MRLVHGLVLLVITTCIGCGTTVSTTMTKSWEKEIVFNKENLWHTQMHLTDEGESVTLVSPEGVETLDSKGSTVYEVDRQKLFRTYIHTTRGAEELTDKIAYIYLPHRHSLLEFNYSMTAESVTLINLDSREINWINEDMKWSLERYQVLVRAAAKGMGLLGGATASAASEILLPERFVKNMTTVIPELDAFLFKTLDGLKLISLEDGTVLWDNDDVKGGITKMFYDADSHSIVVVNSDDDAFKLEGLQFNKQIARLDAESGATIWTNSYDGNIREKVDGIGIWADREADIRLVNDIVMINFLNVELYDFETGEQLWQTTEGADRLLDLVAPEAQIMNQFAFPVMSDDKLYRVGHENVGLTGVDVIVEAYDLYSGEMVWKSDKLSRSKPINNMEVFGDKLIVSMGSSEGVVALDTSDGSRMWEYDGFGRRGVQHHLYTTPDGIIAAGGSKVVLLDPESGDESFTIDTDSDGIGDVQDLSVMSSELAVSGSKGFAIYDSNDGSVLKTIETPTGGLLVSGDDRVLVRPKPAYADASYPIDGAFYVVDPKAGELLGTLGTDSSRRAWKVDDSFRRFYVLTDNKLEMYEVR